MVPTDLSLLLVALLAALLGWPLSMRTFVVRGLLAMLSAGRSPGGLIAVRGLLSLLQSFVVVVRLPVGAQVLLRVVAKSCRSAAMLRGRVE